MKYHTDNNIGQLRAAAENGKVVYCEVRKEKKNDSKRKETQSISNWTSRS